MITITLSARQRAAARNATALLKGLAQGLEATGSRHTVDEMHRYVATLDRICDAGDRIDLTSQEKNHIEQTQFLLEGVREGLLNAEFDKRAGEIEEDILALSEIITAFNTAATTGRR